MAGTAMGPTGETPVPPPPAPRPTHTLDRSRCELCGRCLAACPAGALALAGRTVRPAEIIQRAVRMKPFFRHSGGGVTLTGGEVTLQPAFAAAVLAGCRAEGIHTAVETCGACAWDRLAALLDHTDLVLYDLKLIDDAEHRRWTGGSNAPILANARRLAAAATAGQGPALAVELRVPLIPGITDTRANLGGIFAFAQGRPRPYRRCCPTTPPPAPSMNGSPATTPSTPVRTRNPNSPPSSPKPAPRAWTHGSGNAPRKRGQGPFPFRPEGPWRRKHSKTKASGGHPRPEEVPGPSGMKISVYPSGSAGLKGRDSTAQANGLGYRPEAESSPEWAI